MTAPTYANRLTAARQLVAAAQIVQPPSGFVDQVDAATREAGRLYRRVAADLIGSDPERGWKPHAPADAEEQMEATARLTAAVADCKPCTHLRHRPVQAAVAALALHRMRCLRCAATRLHAPPGEDDRCDVCGSHGVSRFTPFSVQMSYVLVIGDACDGCAAGLGVVTG